MIVRPATQTSQPQPAWPATEAWLADSWQHQPPDIAITIYRIDINGDHVRATWTCDSSAFASPARGTHS